MWIGVKPEEMCDQHLRGEHAECHQEVGSLLNHPHGQAIVQGHVEKGQVSLWQIEHRHTCLVHEMEQRDMNHDSPLEITEEIVNNPLWNVDNIDPEYNREDLNERCENCLTQGD